ncbi:sorbosone dehydrogenase family protein, partial [candidate division WWE3 bacterium]|nr:sorbosone dehydrogenase family protein [candidate division WWE3 bacterium]
ALTFTPAYLLVSFFGAEKEDLIQDVRDLADAGGEEPVADNAGLKVPAGFNLEVYVKDLVKPRDLEFSPGGTLLVTETESGRLVAIPDKDKNNQPDEVKELLGDLTKPHGVAFYNGKLYLAEETRVSRFEWNEESLTTALDRVIVTLPKGGRHFTRSLDFDKDGRLYISIGSTCDVCGEEFEFLSAVLVTDTEGNDLRVYSSGLRNAVFIKLNEDSNEIWATEMGRDFLGDSLPPDEINILRSGANYGWPNCYGAKIPDTLFNPKLTTDSCLGTEPPVYEICSHCAPLGLSFIKSSQFPADWQGDLLVSYHGSWNSTKRVGYKIVRMDIEGSKVTTESDFITGFLENGEIAGRPVDLEFDQSGNLFVSDDGSGRIYRVSKKAQTPR